MATSGLWALVSGEMELQSNQHGAWIAFGAACIGMKNETVFFLYLMNLIHGHMYIKYYLSTFFNMALEVTARHMSVMREAASHGSWSQHSGDTPVDNARNQGRDEIITMLERAESWLHKWVDGSSSVGAALFSTDVNRALVPLEAWSYNENWHWTAPQLCDLLDWCWSWACGAFHVSHTQNGYQNAQNCAWTQCENYSA